MINLYGRYPTKTAAPTQTDPHGSGRDVSSPGAADGTPWVAAIFNTIWSFLEAVIYRSQANIADTVDDAVTNEPLNALLSLTGSEYRFTTDALGRPVHVDFFRSTEYDQDGDRGGASWRATGNTVQGSAGTIVADYGLLYDMDGKEFTQADDEITFEQYGLAYQDVVDLAARRGKPIRLLSSATYDLNTGTLTVPSGVRIFGTLPETGSNASAPVISSTVASAVQPAILVQQGNGSPVARAVVFENFSIDCPGGVALEINNGDGVIIRNVKASGSGDYSIKLSGVACVLEDVEVWKTGGVNNTGIYVITGYDHRLVRPRFNASQNGEDWTPIEIGGFAYRTQISGVKYYKSQTVAPIVDAGRDTMFVDGWTMQSDLMDNAVGGIFHLKGPRRDCFINRAWVVYTSENNGTNTVAIGRAVGDGNDPDLDYFAEHTLTNNMKYQQETISLASASGAEVTETGLIAFSIGNSGSTGKVYVYAEFLPYRGRV